MTDVSTGAERQRAAGRGLWPAIAGATARIEAGSHRILVWCVELRRRPLYVRLGIAVVLVVLAFAVRWMLIGHYGEPGRRMAYPLFYPVVMISAVLGGTIAGALSVALSVIAVSVWVLPNSNPVDWASTTVFVISSVLMVAMTTALHSAQLKLRDEATRREGDLRLRAVFDQQFQFMAVLSPDGRLRDVNEMPLRRHGIRREDVIGRPFMDAPWFRHVPDVRAVWPKRLATAAAQSGPLTYQERFSTPDGSEGSVEASVTPIRNDDGQLQFFVVQAHDTTDAKRAAATILESSEQLRLAVDVAELGFFDHDHKRDVVSTSPQWRRMFGIRADEIVSQAKCIALAHPDDRAWVSAAIERAHDPASDGRYKIEHRVVMSDGRVRWVMLRSQTFFEGEGEDRRPVRTIGVMRDVTDRKDDEQRQTRLVAELDHRVKNTLDLVGTILTFSRHNSRSAAEFMDTCENRIQAMAKAHALLSRNRWRDVDLGAVVREQVAPFERPGQVAIEGCDIALEPNVARTLAMLLHELVTNAAKYGALSRGDGRVRVMCSRYDPSPAACGDTKSPTAAGREQASGLMLVWQELGGPPVEPPSRTGFGSFLIREMVGYELDGKVELMFAPAGLRCAVYIPDLELNRRHNGRLDTGVTLFGDATASSDARTGSPSGLDRTH